jgi:hypothetical protein
MFVYACKRTTLLPVEASDFPEALANSSPVRCASNLGLLLHLDGFLFPWFSGGLHFIIDI